MREPASAEHCGPHRADNLLDRGVLGQEPHRARPDRVQRRGDVSVGGQHHDRGRERQGGHLPGEVDAAHLTEAQIHDHRVRLYRRRDTKRLIRVADRHRLEVRFGREDSLKTLAEDAVVVNDKQAGSHYPLRASGVPSGSRRPGTSTIPSRTA
jgi:hypothetical protein